MSTTQRSAARLSRMPLWLHGHRSSTRGKAPVPNAQRKNEHQVYAQDREGVSRKGRSMGLRGKPVLLTTCHIQVFRKYSVCTCKKYILYVYIIYTYIINRHIDKNNAQIVPRQSGVEVVAGKDILMSNQRICPYIVHTPTFLLLLTVVLSVSLFWHACSFRGIWKMWTWTCSAILCSG